MIASQFFTPILAKKSLNDQMLEIRFKKPTDFEYDAGQFVQLIVPSAVGGETTRSYSLSSTPTDEYLEFGVKLYENGLASQYLQKACIGDEVTLNGPLGRFVNTTSGPIAGVATGAGLVPIMSIISDELRNKKNIAPIQVLFGVRMQNNLFWLDRLENLQKEFSNFSYTVTLSQPTPTWPGVAGRVTDHINNLNFASQFFLCGSPEMVKDVRGKLIAGGTIPTSIHLEIF